jgi:UDP-glucose 4-epimerase
VYNIGMGQSSTILDLVGHLYQLLGTRLDPIYAPARPGDVRYSRADISRARSELGYDPKISFREGLRFALEGDVSARSPSGRG